jgi:dTDP-4-dehydrorhamnose reductase
MNSTSFIILGANGQVGRALQACYPDAKALDSDALDITNYNAVMNYGWDGITTILNGAAFTNVDLAESANGRVAAWKVNAVGPRNLAAIAQQRDITLVHISSDYVFDGTHKNHSEDEEFSPLGVYGQSKAAGDIAVSLSLKHYILRATWVIGDGKNFVRTMLNLGQKGIAPTVVSDQVGRLTFSEEIVRVIDHLLKSNSDFGTYNVTNSGEPASWADITRQIFKDGGFNLQVTDTSTANYFAGKEGTAPRPLDSSMDLNKLAQTGFESRSWEKELKAYIKKELAS